VAHTTHLFLRIKSSILERLWLVTTTFAKTIPIQRAFAWRKLARFLSGIYQPRSSGTDTKRAQHLAL
jgi:hypothetical protein